jgi:hypothetical protein
LILPDQNRNESDVLILRFGDNELRVYPQFNEYAKYLYGICIADMAHAIDEEREHRTSVEIAYHVTDVMLAFEEADAEDICKEITSTSKKPSGLWETEDTIL